MRRSQKQVSVRGLIRNHNHDLKNLFKGAATVATAKPGRFQEFSDALVAKASSSRWLYEPKPSPKAG